MMRQANITPEINSEGFIFHHREGKDQECNVDAGDLLQARLQRLKSLCTMKTPGGGDVRGLEASSVLGVPSASQALILPRH